MLSFISSLLMNIIFSILIIYLLHELWEYLKNRFSTKKTIDVFQVQNEKYDKIINNLSKNNSIPKKQEDSDEFKKLNQELLDFSESQLENSEI